MTDASEDFKFTLKVMVDKKKRKVLFAESDCQFVDVLLSFLTLPLGRIIRALSHHYVEKAPTIGSLSNLYRSLACADNAYFVTEDAKKLLLNPRSPFEVEYGKLKLSVTDSHIISIKCPPSYFRKVDVPKINECEGVFTAPRSSFIISDDLQIFPSVIGICQIVSLLGITNMDKAEAFDVKIGFNQIMSLLKGSFVSPTPLSYFLLNKTSLPLALEPKTLVNPNEFQEKVGAKKMVLKVFIQRSQTKVLYAIAEDDVVEFLFTFFVIPLGGVEHLLSGKTCVKAIDNLQRSVVDLIGDKYFKSPNMKSRLIKPSLVHGSVSENYILPLDQQCMTREELQYIRLCSLKFLKGQDRYLERPVAYMVTDDLTVNPLCIRSTISFLREKNIPMSDVKEIEVQVGLKEALSILKASLTSTSALTDALLNSMPIKQPKAEA